MINEQVTLSQTSRRKPAKVALRNKVTILAVAFIVISIAILSSIILIKVDKSMQEQMASEGYNLAENIKTQMILADETDTIMLKLLDEKLLAVCNMMKAVDASNYNNEFLNKIKENTGLDEINLVDSNKIIVYSSEVSIIGDGYDSSHKMNAVFDSSKDFYTEDIRDSATGATNIKFGGANLHNGYYIQIGLDANFFVDLKNKVNKQSILDKVAKENSVVYTGLLDTKGFEFLGTNDNVGQTFTDEGTMTAVRDGKPYANFYYDEQTKEEVYEVLLPMNDEDGNLVGAINVGLSTSDLKKAQKAIRFESVLVAVLSVLIASTSIYFCIRHFLQPLKRAANSLEQIAAGDLTGEIHHIFLDSEDEIGYISKAIAKMQDSLRLLMGSIQDSAEAMNIASADLAEAVEDTTKATDEISAAVEQIANSSEYQAGKAEKTAESAIDLGTKIDEVNDFVQESYDISMITNTSCKKGGVNMSELTKIIVESGESAMEVSNIVNKVHAFAQDAETITVFIEGIANQTNLLALNASIEAARAGEAGKGFAVVAEEIRKLAEGTSDATNNIKELIQNIQGQSEGAVSAMKKVQEITERQNVSVKSTTEIFESTNGVVSKLVSNMKETLAHTKAVDLYKDEIVEAMESISTVLQETSAATEEVSASTEEQLATMEEVTSHADSSKDVANRLLAEIEKFKI